MKASFLWVALAVLWCVFGTIDLIEGNNPEHSLVMMFLSLILAKLSKLEEA